MGDPAIRIGLIGDRDDAVTAHRAIPIALRLAGEAAGRRVDFDWLPTDGIDSEARLRGYHGLWCVPASPYRSMDGALRAIRFAREAGRPFLGTCGGFQHAVIEYAHNVLGWGEAAHAEIDPGVESPLIAPLACALVERTAEVRFGPGSRLRAAYGADRSIEGYRCSYGLNPALRERLVTGALRERLVTGALRVAATDPEGEVRGLELADHPFFVLTLFQPERAALRGIVPPPVAAFVDAAAGAAMHADRRRAGHGSP